MCEAAVLEYLRSRGGRAKVSEVKNALHPRYSKIYVRKVLNQLIDQKILHTMPRHHGQEWVLILQER